jgi:hypothetical protein
MQDGVCSTGLGSKGSAAPQQHTPAASRSRCFAKVIHTYTHTWMGHSLHAAEQHCSQVSKASCPLPLFLPVLSTAIRAQLLLLLLTQACLSRPRSCNRAPHRISGFRSVAPPPGCHPMPAAQSRGAQYASQRTCRWSRTCAAGPTPAPSQTWCRDRRAVCEQDEGDQGPHTQQLERRYGPVKLGSLYMLHNTCQAMLGACPRVGLCTDTM